MIIEWALYYLMNTSHYLEERYKMCGPIKVHMYTQAHTAHVAYLVEHGFLDEEFNLQSSEEHIAVGEDILGHEWWLYEGQVYSEVKEAEFIETVELAEGVIVRESRGDLWEKSCSLLG